MNLEDLKQTLTSMAEEVDPADRTDRLSAVERKVQAARRQRIGAVVGCTAAVAVVGLVLPGLVDAGHKPDPSTTTTATTQVASNLPTVQDKGVRFYTSPAGDTLLGEAMGKPGGRSVTLRVVATTTNLSYQSLCLGPDETQDKGFIYSVRINGHPIADSSCGGEVEPVSSNGGSFGFSPQANSNAWRHDIGVVPGQEMTLRVFLKPGVHVAAASSPIQLGIALYAETGPVVMSHGVAVSQLAVFDGHEYELVTSGFTRVTTLAGRQTVDLPRADKPLYLVYGVADVHSSYVMTTDTSGMSASTGSALDSLARLDQQTAYQHIRFHAAKAPSALLYILAYQRTD